VIHAPATDYEARRISQGLREREFTAWRPFVGPPHEPLSVVVTGSVEELSPQGCLCHASAFNVEHQALGVLGPAERARASHARGICKSGSEAALTWLSIVPGATLTEMPRNSERSFCCGAGGARMWMEESQANPST
jgi:hypothetical protein